MNLLIFSVCYVSLLHSFVIDAKPTENDASDKVNAMRLMKKISGDISSRIVGGAVASAFQFPWMAYIELDGKYICGGTLISSRHVLTSAVLVEEVKKFAILLFNGDFNNVKGEKAYFESTTKILHPDYSAKTIPNNLAFIVLRSDVKISANIRPIRLPAQSQVTEDFAGMEAIVAGWGVVSDDGTSGSTVLKYTSLTIMSQSECSKLLNNEPSTSIICAKGDGQTNACLGDDGGPLQIKEKDGEWTLVGNLFFTVSKKCTRYPSVYDRITSFLPWISKVTGVSLRP